MENENKPDRQGQNSKDPTNITVAAKPTDSQPSGKTAQNPQQKRYAKLAKPILPQVAWTKIFGVLGVIIGAGVCYIYWNQLQVMSGQLTEM